MRLIDADDLRDNFLRETCVFTPNDVLDYIDTTCTVDDNPVVRCKDCKRWQRHTQVNRDYGECRRFSVTTKNDDFCSRGERRG